MGRDVADNHTEVTPHLSSSVSIYLGDEMKKKSASYKAVVQLPLLPDHVPAVVGLAESLTEELIPLIETIVKDGYKLSVSWEGSKGHFSASLYGSSEDSANAGLLIFGNGGTVALAASSVAFKHYYIAGGQAWQDCATKQDSSNVS